MSLLTFENIEKEYQSKALLKGVSLRVEKGDRIALTGANGCGKSTLLKIAMGLENQDKGNVIVARNIRIGYLAQGVNEIRQEGGQLSETVLNHEKVQKVEKRMRELESEMAISRNKEDTVLQKRLLDEYSKLVSRFEALDGYTIESKIKKTLLGLGLREESLSIPVSKLSGGEKVRAAMAKILLEEPELLILDEPTNHLDINAMEWLEDFLKRFDGGVLLVSHDRYFLDSVATKIAELDNGNIIEKRCSYSSFLDQKERIRDFAQKEQKRLRQEIKNTNMLIQDLRAKGKIKASMSRDKTAGKRNEEYKKKLEDMRHGEHLYKNSGPKLSLKNIKHVSKDIAYAEKLSKCFGDVRILNYASFQIRGGEKIGIIGPNGCGKTTLINLLLGKDKDYTGLIRLGEWVKYSYMGQEILFEDENRTIIEDLYSQKEMDDAAARVHLARFQFYGDDINKRISVLSGGERVRLYLANIMLQEPDCLIMDEPTNHLDVSSREAVERAISEFRGTVISISHDRYYLTHCVTRILEIKNGSIKSYDGNFEYYKLLSEVVDTSKQFENVANNEVVNNRKNNPIVKELKNPRNTVSQIEKVESRIVELESKIKSMEDCFSSTTLHDEYIEYENLLNEINNLYSIWEKLTG